MNQVELSEIRVSTGSRYLGRHGDDPADTGVGSYNKSSCFALCLNIIQAGVSWSCPGHYVKCYNSWSPTPLNGIRASFASQQGTMDIDPALP